MKAPGLLKRELFCFSEDAYVYSDTAEPLEGSYASDRVAPGSLIPRWRVLRVEEPLAPG